MPIDIGSVIGGASSANQKTADLIRAASIAADRVADQSPGSAGTIDLVFDVAGPIVQPPYSGIRHGRLSRSQNRLQVQVAVPERFGSEEDVRMFIANAVVDATALANAYMAGRSHNWSPDKLMEIATGVRDALLSQASRNE